MIDSFKEEGRLRRIEATILVERESQKGIVLGAGGERLKQMATAARKDMERLFEGKVYLGVWVKVRRASAPGTPRTRVLGLAQRTRPGTITERAPPPPAVRRPTPT